MLIDFSLLLLLDGLRSGLGYFFVDTSGAIVVKFLDGFVERMKKRGFEAGRDRSTHLGMSSAGTGTSLSGKLSLARPHKIIDY